MATYTCARSSSPPAQPAGLVLMAAVGPDQHIYAVLLSAGFAVYDVTANTWTPLVPADPNINGALGAFAGEQLVVIADDPTYGSVYVYDLTTASWQNRRTIDQNNPAFGVDAFVSVDGVAYVMNSNVVQYDSAADTWAVMGAVPSNLSGFGVGIPHGIFGIGGGLHPDDGDAIFDVQVRQWQAIPNVGPDLPSTVLAFGAGGITMFGLTPRAGAADATLPSDRVQVQSYNPDSGQWSGGPPIPHYPSFGQAVYACDGRFYVFSGTKAENGLPVPGQVQRLDPATGVWESNPP